MVKGNILTILLFLYLTESLNVEFVCNVLVVADQLLITRLKEMCEVVITENCTIHVFHPLTSASIFFHFHMLLSFISSFHLDMHGQNAALLYVDTVVSQ